MQDTGTLVKDAYFRSATRDHTCIDWTLRACYVKVDCFFCTKYGEYVLGTYMIDKVLTSLSWIGHQGCVRGADLMLQYGFSKREGGLILSVCPVS